MSEPAHNGRAALALKAGHVLHEYQIESALGGGGFGITYLARDANLGLPVAIKEYLPAELATRSADGSVVSLGSSSDEQFRWGLERFIDEARALATFRHPNIVRVLRYFAANGTAYIVMEYESGRSLKQWVQPRLPLDRAALLQLVFPLLDGLEMIHGAGFLHRDIKPDNIYMRADSSPVLIDFGSARRAESGRDMTTIVSPGFAPFEQYHANGHQGPWTDLYSLAAVMYWLVTGSKPVESASRLKNDPMEPALAGGDVTLMGEPLLRAIDWALDPEETRRPQTVAEFRARLKLAAATAGAASGAATTAAAAAPEAPRGNMVCTVLFLDIVAYSKVSVSEQYALKSAFNQLITGKLAHILESARITLDTGDGAAICFMGDPEEVLHVSADIRRTLSAHEKLKVRMGLHIGPVRILNDMNGRANVVGDGINAAQRVMSFAGEDALLVSRAYYDVVSCLSDGAERAFRHVGAQADKHGRLHELYEAVPDGVEGGIGDHTFRLDESQSAASAVAIDPAVLAVIERDLARHLGPLAPVLVRKARGRAADAAALRDLLAQSIEDPAQRELFRLARNDTAGNSQTRNASSSSSSSSGHSSGASSGAAFSAGSMPLSGASRSQDVSRFTAPAGQTQPPPAGNFSGGSSGSAGSGPASQSGASVRPWLTQDHLARLEKLLAHTVGPMARVLVKNEVRKAADMAGLCAALALHIDDAAARAKFLKDALALK